VQVTSNSLLWNLEANTVQSDQPVQIVHPTEGVTLTANQGRMDLNQEVVYLNQNVQVVGQRNSARLTSDQLTWQVPTQQVEAVGNVRYSQLNPTMTLQGERADGRLENQTVVVSGGRVVTEIIPE
jgi:lipopolysaccharide assembly outer membrane protein LptD (OstA)